MVISITLLFCFLLTSLIWTQTINLLQHLTTYERLNKGLTYSDGKYFSKKQNK